MASCMTNCSADDLCRYTSPRLVSQAGGIRDVVVADRLRKWVVDICFGLLSQPARVRKVLTTWSGTTRQLICRCATSDCRRLTKCLQCHAVSLGTTPRLNGFCQHRRTSLHVSATYKPSRSFSSMIVALLTAFSVQHDSRDM